MRCAIVVALIVFASATAAAATESGGLEWAKQVNATLERHHNWIRAAEDILAHVVLGPLQDQLKAAAFSQRNRTQIIHVQTNHLRAHVMQRLLQALEEQVQICPWPAHISREAVDAVLTELKRHEFQAAWVPDLYRCPGHGGYINVHVPLPAF
jgi:hypothetical protein